MEKRYMSTLRQEKREREDANFDILTGRRHGKFFTKGDPRGNWQIPIIESNEVYYPAIEFPDEVIFNALGIGDNGIRTKYRDLRPAIGDPIPVTSVTIYDRKGKFVSRKVIIGDEVE